MTAASVKKSGVHLVEKLVGAISTGGTGTTVPITDIVTSASVSSANPADITGITNASGIVTAAVTVTGAVAGDVVLGWGVVSGLATNQLPLSCYVSGTDTVTLTVGNLSGQSVTTTAVVLNVILAHIT